MAHENFLKLLQCPYCGEGFDLEWREPATGPDVEFGVLRCQCYRYGIVLGMAVLRQFSPTHNIEDPLVAQLDELEYGKAIQFLLASAQPLSAVERRSRFTRIADAILNRDPLFSSEVPQIIQPTETLRAALLRLRPMYYGEYLYYRHANPSLLAALPILAAMASDVESAEGASLSLTSEASDDLWSIDLGCGIGHTAYTLNALLPQTRIVAADLDPLNLLFARSFFVPDANFICFDAEAGIPFRDGIFRTAFSLDCVHYIRGKVGLAKELRRVSRPDALYAITHLHNAASTNPNPGIPLTADGYLRVFQPLSGAIYPEAELLRNFHRTGILLLNEVTKYDSLQTSNAFAYLSFGSKTNNLSYHSLDRCIARRSDHLALNPLYESITAEGSLDLRLRWPSQALREECCADFQPLPEKVEIAAELMKSVLSRCLGDLPAETLETLIRSCVIVPEPSGEYLLGSLRGRGACAGNRPSGLPHG